MFYLPFKIMTLWIIIANITTLVPSSNLLFILESIQFWNLIFLAFYKKNEKGETLQNFQSYPLELNFRLEWD